MALKITDNFDHTSDQPNFKRDQFTTREQMKACTVCDDGHLSYCVQVGTWFAFKRTNSFDETTGYWREFTPGGGGGATDADELTYDSTKETHTEGSAGAELAKLDEAIGNLDDLETTSKTSIVAALNEINGKAGEQIVNHSDSTLSIAISSYAKNVYIECSTALTSISIDNSSSSTFEIVIHFTASSSWEALSLTNDAKIIDDPDYFDIEAGGEYEISIRNNIFVLAEINDKTIASTTSE